MKIKKIIIGLILVMIFWVGGVGLAYAGSLTLDIESPKTPTNLKDFRLGFVALDVEERTVIVSCFIKKPGEGFNQFDTYKTLPPGGSSGYCQVDGGDIGSSGTYEFYVVATAGSDSVTSKTVSILYGDSQPGTPTNYSKNREPDGCSYIIKFKTADDGGRTSKVELYRSENTSFSADSGTKIAEVGIGSNLEGQFTTALPTCSKTYYFVIRAFDSYGNGSGIVGDESTTVTVNQVTPTATAQAVAVADSRSQVQGSDQVVPDDQGKVLGEENVIITPTLTDESDGVLGDDTTSKGGLGKYLIYLPIPILVFFLGYYLIKRLRGY